MSDDNRIGRLSRLLEYVQLASASSAERKKPAEAATTGRPRETAPRRDVAELKRRLAERLRDVDVDRPGDLDRARQTIVREILLWEFGDSFINHGEFRTMLGKIEATIGAQPELKDHVRQITVEIQGR